MDASLGASLVLEGYDEVDGEKNVFLQLPLFSDPDIYTFPELCLAFSTISSGYCYAPLYGDDPETTDGTTVVTWEKRDLVSLEERDLSTRTNRSYTLKCDAAPKQYIYVQKYPSPQVLKSVPGVPIIEPLIRCEDDDCPPEKWKIQEATDPSVVTEKGWNCKSDHLSLIGSSRISMGANNVFQAEHIYEGNWIPAFINYLVDNYYVNADDETEKAKVCNGSLDTFGAPRQITTPELTPAANYSEALMQNLGTRFTAGNLMALLPQIQNTMKYNVRYYIT